jgi:hypothetical protein
MTPLRQNRPRGHCDGQGPELLSGRFPPGLTSLAARWGVAKRKAADFDSAMRRFESSRPSHAFQEFGDFAMTGTEARIPPASVGAEIGDRLEWVSGSLMGGPVSNPEFPISGICPWACRDR